MWEARGRVPTAVVATADFVQLQLSDKYDICICRTDCGDRMITL